MALWDTYFGVGAKEAERVQDTYYKGRKQEMEDAVAQTNYGNITMKQLEDSLTQPSRLGSTIGTNLQKINQVRPEVVQSAGGFAGAQKLEDMALDVDDKTLKDIFAKEYGGGDYKKAKAFLEKNIDNFQHLYDSAVEAYRRNPAKYKQPDRGPQGEVSQPITMERLNIRSERDAKGNLRVIESPQVVATPAPQIVVQPPQAVVQPVVQAPITAEQLIPREAPPTVIEGQVYAPPNMFDPQVQIGRANEMMRTNLSDAELEMAKGQQQVNAMANKFVFEQQMKQVAQQNEINAANYRADADRDQKARDAFIQQQIDILGLETNRKKPPGRSGSSGNTFAEKLDLKTIDQINKIKNQAMVMGGAKNAGARKFVRSKINSLLTAEARAKAEADLADYITPSVRPGAPAVKGQADESKVKVSNGKKSFYIDRSRLKDAAKDGYKEVK